MNREDQAVADRMLALENEIDALMLASITNWLTKVRADVLPSLTAAAEEPAEEQGVPPDVAALIVAGAVLWEAEIDGVFLPAFAGLLADIGRTELTGGSARVEVDQFGSGETESDQIGDWITQHVASVRDRLLGAPGAAVRAVQAAVDTAAPNVPAQRAAARHELTDPQSRTWRSFAARVARTEAAAGFNGIRVAAASIRDRARAAFDRLRGRSTREAAEETPKRLVKRWVTQHDSRVRHTHEDADGQQVELGGAFQVGGYSLRVPGDPLGPPEEVMNCVVGSTQVGWPGQGVLNTTSRSYSGTFLDLVVADGRVLTITPNHPVLTPTGYVLAGSLRPGDEVMCTPISDTPQETDAVASIEEVHRAAGDSGTAQRVLARSLDFHGDATEGQEVEVVRTNGDLRDEFGERGNVLSRGASAESNPSSSCATVDSGSDLVNGVGLTTGSIRSRGAVSGQSVSSPFLDGQSTHSDRVRLADRPHGNAHLVEASDDGGSGNAEALRHLQHAHAFGMQPAELIEVNRYTASHQVFNLSTTDQWYTASGIAVHNCRCFIAVDEVDQAAQVASATPSGGSVMKTFRANIIPLGVFGRSQGWMLGNTVELVDTVLPQAMKWQKTADPAHTGAYTVAAIEQYAVENGWIVGLGTWLDTPEAAEAAAEVAAGVTRPSVELVGRTEVMTDAAGNPIPMETAEALSMDGERIGFRIDVAEIVATTLVSVPEFRDASITFADAEADHAAPALVAGLTVVEDTYDEAMFANPNLGEPVPIHLTSEGRVQGYLATWDCQHLSANMRPYRTHSGYAEFHQSHVKLASGDRLRVGRLTVGGGHAQAGVGMRAATEHYDNIGTCWALVRAYEDEIGIVVSGVLNAAADEAMVKQALGTPHSGHWERVGGHPELIAACAVNVPAYPIRCRDRDGDLALVASFAPRWPNNTIDTRVLDDVAVRAVRAFAEEQQAQVRAAAARTMIGARRKQILADVIRRNHAAREKASA